MHFITGVILPPEFNDHPKALTESVASRLLDPHSEHHPWEPKVIVVSEREVANRLESMEGKGNLDTDEQKVAVYSSWDWTHISYMGPVWLYETTIPAVPFHDYYSWLGVTAKASRAANVARDRFGGLSHLVGWDGGVASRMAGYEFMPKELWAADWEGNTPMRSHCEAEWQARYPLVLAGYPEDALVAFFDVHR